MTLIPHSTKIILLIVNNTVSGRANGCGYRDRCTRARSCYATAKRQRSVYKP